MKYILMVMITLLPLVSVAAPVNQETCNAITTKIATKLDQMNHCKTNKDCKAIDVECPWSNGCGFPLVNIKESVESLRPELDEYKPCNSAVKSLKEMYRQCDHFRKTADCLAPEFIKGKCVMNKCQPAL